MLHFLPQQTWPWKNSDRTKLDFFFFKTSTLAGEKGEATSGGKMTQHHGVFVTRSCHRWIWTLHFHMNIPGFFFFVQTFFVWGRRSLFRRWRTGHSPWIKNPDPLRVSVLSTQTFITTVALVGTAGFIRLWCRVALNAKCAETSLLRYSDVKSKT